MSDVNLLETSDSLQGYFRSLGAIPAAPLVDLEAPDAYTVVIRRYSNPFNESLRREKENQELCE